MSTDTFQNPFTQFYAQLLHQGNMLADGVRTTAYQHAILGNNIDFKDKVVLDVGTGTGILAFFAAQAGAKKVYAVEASDSAITARKLSEANGYSNRVVVIQGKIEEIDLPEKVDIIISEPIGFLLVHERMLESYVVARDRFLKPGGLMFPTTGSIVIAPFTDYALYSEQEAKLQFWNNNSFYGVDLTPLMEQAGDEYFTHAVVGNFNMDILLSSFRTMHTIDFTTVTGPELQSFEIPFSFPIHKTGIIHGIAGWFDIHFRGSSELIVLSTAPDAALTHWYQCRMLLKDTLAVNKGQSISGKLVFKVNNKFSYDIETLVKLDGTGIVSENVCHLHDQVYHYLQPL